MHAYFTFEDSDCVHTYMYSVLNAENEKVYYARPSELLYGELLPRYIASVLSVYKQAKQSDP